MKKILDAHCGRYGETVLVHNGLRIFNPESDLPRILEKECNPYTNHDDEGVVVYMSKQEFERLQTPPPKSDTLENKSQ